LLSGSSDGSLILWNVSPEEWRARACRMANRNLTMEEWNRYMGPDTPYQVTCPGLPASR
jgi:hypothetical protein